MPENLPVKIEPIDARLPVRNTKQLSALLAQEREKLEILGSKFLSAERLFDFSISAMRKSKVSAKLFACTGVSVLKSIKDCGELGLVPTTVLGQAYFIPYGKECTLQVGYKGFLELARRSGQTSHIMPHVVHEGDAFGYRYGTEPFLKHTPAGVPGSKPIHIYAIAYLVTGGPPAFEVMTTEEINAHRDKYSKAKDNGPWVTAWEEMAKKTVIRKLCKYLSLSPELIQATSIDEYNEAGIGIAQTIPLDRPGRFGFDALPAPASEDEGAGAHEEHAEVPPQNESAPRSTPRTAQEEVNDSMAENPEKEPLDDTTIERAGF